ncbi:efflux RND transporter permease subunit [Meridianimarinicoccus sp. RP-17]|uniref:efflux RND transporter permease subunit n=1 Tax=Meridianimarinicoccus zhengii TaxID=2056810 RepID=UPI000DACA39E|nr:efflux RND transporter permease subunit [Phycocomes zhengii]
MNPIRLSIERPVAIMAVVVMAVMFGALALSRIPVQLAPDVRKPVVVVKTAWPGAAPIEVEREIVNPQEEALRGIGGLDIMTSRAQTGEAEVTLEFAVGTDMTETLLLVSNRLDRVGGYPEEAGEPTLETSGADDSAIAWITVTREPGVTTPMPQFGDFMEDVVKERLERVPGVSAVNVFGGVSRELQIVVRPDDMARYGLTIPEIVSLLRSENITLSAGDVDEGKRRYVVRAEGSLNTVDAVRNVVLRSEGGETLTGPRGRLRLGDVADVRFGYKEPSARIRFKGEPAMAVNVVRETGANVIETMAEIRVVLAELADGPVAAEGLRMQQVYDETVYIEGAIDLVVQNIWIGGLLAACVLLLFLRSPAATLVVSLAIPVSIVATFVAMAATGRTLNVISLAGIAFAVGMIVDAAIVVLENIYRLRETGMNRREAAYHGARQVWGAILVSALTTVMVFIPILVMELEAGQLFRDIAVAISVSVLLSLAVAVTVIPALASRLLRGGEAGQKPLRLPVIDHFGAAFKAAVMAYTRMTVRYRAVGLAMVAVIAGGAGTAAWMALPKLEYLPEGNRNLVFGLMIPPPGYNLDTTETIAQRIEDTARPLWEAAPEPATADGQPSIDSFFFVALPGNSFVGAAAVDGERVGELIPLLSRPIFAEPGTFGFMTQPSLFGRGVGGGRTIELNVSGQNLDEILGVAGQAAGMIAGLMPRSEGHQFRPIPGLELGAPEVRVIPDRVRLSDAGVGTADIAATVDAFNDGLRVAEITIGAQRRDLTLMGADQPGRRTQDVASFPIVTPSGQIVPLGALAEVRVTAGPTEIRHRDRLRTITLEVRPSPALPLESAVELLQAEVISPLEAQGLPNGVRLTVSGTADQLSQTWDAIQINLAVAMVIVFLVMAVLFESFILPLVIMISVPVAAAGGVGGLALLNTFQTQPLDMLTLLGFVILVGIVVNNAILIVHQSLYHLREDGMTPVDAIEEATRNRIRPIFMSTLTSVCGMLPLVVFPGAGSELYRGLGAVVVGGLSMSAFLTLLTVPPLLRLCLVAPVTEDAAQGAGTVAAPAE